MRPVQVDAAGRPIGIGTALAVIVIALAIWLIVGTIANEDETARFRALPPQQRSEQLRDECRKFLEAMRFKTYSEMNVDERRTVAACEARLQEMPDGSK